MTTQKQKLRSKREITEEKPSIWIGKKGVTEELIKEISNSLKRTKNVKIKILKTALKLNPIKELAKEIADKTNSNIVEIRGHSLTLYKS